MKKLITILLFLLPLFSIGQFYLNDNTIKIKPDGTIDGLKAIVHVGDTLWVGDKSFIRINADTFMITTQRYFNIGNIFYLDTIGNVIINGTLTAKKTIVHSGDTLWIGDISYLIAEADTVKLVSPRYIKLGEQLMIVPNGDIYTGGTLNMKDTIAGVKHSSMFQKGDSLYVDVNDSIYNLTSRQSMGAHHVANDTTQCTTANTYYKITGAWTDGLGVNFITDGISKMSYTGLFALCMVTGHSDVYCSDNTATVTYGMYKNGVLIPGWETVTRFESSIDYQHLGISGLVEIHKGDYFEVWCKSDKANTLITNVSLGLTFICDR